MRTQQEAAEETQKCEKCGAECYRDEVDVGVGVIYGPWGCPNCGWSESSDYDVSAGPRYDTAGRMLDQFGGATPPGNPAYIKPK